MSNEAFIEELWGVARGLFMPDHPWFKGIVEHRWTREQIVLGEIQHYLRVRTNPIFFGYIVTNVASERNYALMDIVMENFMEELGGEKTHVDIMLQMLDEAHDNGHGDRQIEAIRRYATDDETREKCRRAVYLGLNAFNFEWDGHVQAMTGQRTSYWAGKTGKLELRHPEVRLPAKV